MPWYAKRLWSNIFFYHKYIFNLKLHFCCYLFCPAASPDSTQVESVLGRIKIIYVCENRGKIRGVVGSEFVLVNHHIVR